MFAASSSLFVAASVLGAVNAQYLLGLGMGDITGPIVETNMMGYADLSQTDSGLHMRQHARAFIVADAANPSDRVLFVNLDIGMGDTGIRRGILAKLQSLYNGTYTGQNTALSSTHSHAGVGGYVENLLPQLTSLGFVPQAYQAIVDGTVRAVQRAHDSLKPGSLAVGNATVPDANINRSPFSYLQNPAEERARYDGDQDKELSLLNFLDQDGNSRGFLSFFAVHGTSFYQNNTLISSDNKGMAAILYESFVEPDAAPGATTFVAGFAQANVGDTSPNVLGAFCEAPGQPWHGEPCEFRTSTCGNRTQDCRGRGPGYRVSDFESNRIIGERQFEGAKKVLSGGGGALAPVQGIVRSVHQYIDMTNYTFALANGTTVRTCPAALGYSFAGGTTDGPGAFDFVQGNNSTEQNPLWEIIKSFVTPIPSREQIACHAPKPILLNTGMATFPYNWTPHVVDVQILRVGNFVILVVPGEFTTMAGRRIREAVRAKLIKDGAIGNDAYVVLTGPANTYSHYVTTREEYAVQRYEGASTIYGPNTHAAYVDIYTKLTPYLGKNVPANPPANAPAPPDLTKGALSLQTGVVMDGPPPGKKFGDVLVDVAGKTFKAGETVSVTFVGANPRNNLHLEGTYLSVDRLVGGSNFTSVRTDGHPSTKFRWLRTGGGLSPTSEVTITWTIESGTPAGQYRVSYFGDSKPFIGAISPFTGRSGTFTVA